MLGCYILSHQVTSRLYILCCYVLSHPQKEVSTIDLHLHVTLVIKQSAVVICASSLMYSVDITVLIFNSKKFIGCATHIFCMFYNLVNDSLMMQFVIVYLMPIVSSLYMTYTLFSQVKTRLVELHLFPKSNSNCLLVVCL